MVITIGELARKSAALGGASFQKVFPEPAVVILLNAKSHVDSMLRGDLPVEGLLRTDVFFKNDELPLTETAMSESWSEAGEFVLEPGSPVIFLTRQADKSELTLGRDES